MKRAFTTLLINGAAAAALAADPAPKAAAPASSPGLLNEYLRTQSPALNDWDIGGQVRGRFEAKSGFAVSGVPGAVDFSDRTPDNSYWLSRERFHVGWKPVSWLNLFGEARDSHTWEDRRTPEPEEDVLDLHQAYIGLGDPKAFPLTLKVGRQELSYGDERLVGAFDWNNIGRVFDAAKLRFEKDQLWVDAFVGRVVIPRDDTFNTVNDYDWFSGVYASCRGVVPASEAQLYFLSRNVGAESGAAFSASPPTLVAPAGPRDIYTLGLRLKSLPGQLHGWDYGLEVAGQLGNFFDPTLGERLDQEAFAAHVSGGYTFEQTAWKPRLGLEYNYSTGDSAPTDDRHQTFDNLFPTNHKFYGYMDFFSWQNIHNVRLAGSLKPCKGLTITLDAHAFWLADTSDYFYSVSGAPRRTGGYGLRLGGDSFVGTELDIVATYQLARYGSAQAGYGHFFRDDYVKESLSAVGSQDADWFYAQLTFNF
jgi:hypothetical protein